MSDVKRIIFDSGGNLIKVFYLLALCFSGIAVYFIAAAVTGVDELRSGLRLISGKQTN